MEILRDTNEQKKKSERKQTQMEKYRKKHTGKQNKTKHANQTSKEKP